MPNAFKPSKSLDGILWDSCLIVWDSAYKNAERKNCLKVSVFSEIDKASEEKKETPLNS